MQIHPSTPSVRQMFCLCPIFFQNKVLAIGGFVFIIRVFMIPQFLSLNIVSRIPSTNYVLNYFTFPGVSFQAGRRTQRPVV